MPVVSVIMPTYNRAQFIEDSIASVLRQTLDQFELIVVDDGSTDGTADKVRGFGDARIRYLAHETNRGSAQATCTGLSAARGRYIALLDSDDIALPHRLDTQTRLMDAQPRLSIVGSHMQCFGESDLVAGAPSDDASIKANLIAGTANVYNPTAMLRREFLMKHDLHWKAEDGRAFDWALYVAAMFCGARFANVPEPLVQYRVHSCQQSKDQSVLRRELSVVRLRVMAAFLPHLTSEERIALEPLLQWVQPPALSRQAVIRGMQALAKARLDSPSYYGECREALQRFLTACQARWTTALGDAGARP